MRTPRHAVFPPVLLALAPLAAGQHAIHNPVLRGFSPDPSIVRAGEDYYIATSTFEYFPGVRLHHSRDLVHWRVLGHALTRRSQLDLRGNPASGGVWAPGLSFSDGCFYLAYTNVKSREGGFVDGRNYLVSAPDVHGPWSEPVFLHSRGFDPQLFHARDGRKWLLSMVWDHRLAKRSGGIELQEYDPEQRALLGEPRVIFRGTELGGTEAAQLYERGGWFHLMSAEGGTGYGHAVTMARARRIEGPYELDPGNPILTSRDAPELALQKAGHAGLVETPAGECFLAFLCARPLPGTRLCPLGRETALARCAWNAAGWLRLADGDRHPTLEQPAPDLSPHPFPPEATRADFDAPDLPPQLYTLREPHDKRWLSLAARPGWLRLVGRASPTSRFDQSLVARRLESLHSRVETRLEFAPRNHHQMAGLICRYDELNYRYLRIGRDADLGRNAAVIAVERGRLAISERVPVGERGALWLRAIFDGPELRFAWSPDGTTWHPVGAPHESGKLSDESCRGFTGSFVGVCAQDLGGAGLHADFDYFDLTDTER